MKRLITLILAITCVQFSIAQQIVNAEYFLDTDPGVGNGTSISISTPNDTVTQSFSIPTGAIPYGPHHLWIRSQDDLGQWSIYSDQVIYISDTNSLLIDQPQIVAAEYFFDTDPGVGNGVDIPFVAGDTVETTFNINTFWRDDNERLQPHEEGIMNDVILDGERMEGDFSLKMIEQAGGGRRTRRKSKRGKSKSKRRKSRKKSKTRRRRR